MATTTAGAYLIIARYNRSKWKDLSALQQKEAHEKAEKLLPELRYPVPQLKEEERAALQELTVQEYTELQQLEAETAPLERALGEQRTLQQLSLEKRAAALGLSLEKLEEHEEKRERIEALKTRSEDEIEQGLKHLDGVRLLHSFHTRAFAEINEKVLATEQPGQIKLLPEKTEEQQRLEVDALFTAPGTHEEDPGMGWIAVVDYDKFDSFVYKMGGKTGPLWRMYDIEVIPLNNDRTTKDVYDFMTPVAWNK